MYKLLESKIITINSQNFKKIAIFAVFHGKNCICSNIACLNKVARENQSLNVELTEAYLAAVCLLPIHTNKNIKKLHLSHEKC